MDIFTTLAGSQLEAGTTEILDQVGWTVARHTLTRGRWPDTNMIWSVHLAMERILESVNTYIDHPTPSTSSINTVENTLENIQRKIHELNVGRTPNQEAIDDLVKEIEELDPNSSSGVIDFNISDLLAFDQDEKMESDVHLHEHLMNTTDAGTDHNMNTDTTFTVSGTDLPEKNEGTDPDWNDLAPKSGDLPEDNLLDETLPPVPPAPQRTSTPARTSNPEKFPSKDIRKKSPATRKLIREKNDREYEEARVLREAREKREKLEKERKAAERQGNRQPTKECSSSRPPAHAPRKFLLPTPPTPPLSHFQAPNGPPTLGRAQPSTSQQDRSRGKDESAPPSSQGGHRSPRDRSRSYDTPATKRIRGSLRHRLLIVGSLLPKLLEPGVPRDIEEVHLLHSPKMHLDDVLTKITEFIQNSKVDLFHVVFTDFEGMIPKDDSAPRKLIALLRNCDIALHEACRRHHHHGHGEHCWITAFNYYSDPTLIGPNISRDQRLKTEDRLDLMKSTLSSIEDKLTNLYHIQITRFIRTDAHRKFDPDSGAPRESLRLWLREELRKDTLHAFHLS